MSEAIVWLLFAIRAKFSIDLSVPSSIVYGNPGTFPHLQPTRGTTPARLCPSGLVARNTSETSSVQGSFGASTPQKRQDAGISIGMTFMLFSVESVMDSTRVPPAEASPLEPSIGLDAPAPSPAPAADV
jgi:hypothetical protein